jgi:hypothetical protein
MHKTKVRKEQHWNPVLVKAYVNLLGMEFNTKTQEHVSTGRRGWLLAYHFPRIPVSMRQETWRFT